MPEHPGQALLIAVAVVEDAGRFLIGLRLPGGPLAGYWEFPGGKVQPGETPPAAAARECLEETGLEVSIGPALATVPFAYDQALVKLHFFAARPLRAVAALPARFRWVPAGALGEYTFPPANRGLLELLARRDPHR
jgi:mutator protein MutT